MLSSTQSSLFSSQIYTVILAADIQHSTHSELSPRLNQQRAKETIVRSRTNSRIPCDWFTSQGAAVDIVRKLNFFVGLLGPEWSLRPVGFLFKSLKEGPNRCPKMEWTFWKDSKSLLTGDALIFDWKIFEDQEGGSPKSKIPWFSPMRSIDSKFWGAVVPQVRKYL